MLKESVKDPWILCAITNKKKIVRRILSSRVRELKAEKVEKEAIRGAIREASVRARTSGAKAEDEMLIN